MKRLILTILALGVPLAARAQQPDARPLEGIVLAAADTAAGSAAAVQSPASPASVPHRRPSMVGYIENAEIGTKFRVRFDNSTGLQAADRAEFFYAKCGCYRYLPASNAAYDPSAPGPGPGVLQSADFRQMNVYAEYALNGRFSVVGDLPLRWLNPKEFVPGTGSFGDTSGISDLRFGAKLGLASDSNSQITLQVMAAAPTGDSMKGLGTNHWSIDPAVLYNTRMGDRVGLEAQFGSSIPTSGSKGVPTTSPDKFSGSVIYYGAGPSVDVYRSGTVVFAPVVEFVAWHVVDGYSTFDGGPANGTNIVNLKVGGRLGFGEHSIYAGWGKALTTAKWYDQIVRIEYRYGF